MDTAEDAIVIAGRRRMYMECLDYMWWMPVRFRFWRLVFSSLLYNV
jgi:hypothetical protein